MIKVDVRLPSKAELMRAAMAEVEKHATQTARRAAAMHGGVRIRFVRKSDGSLPSVEFQGSRAAIAAAQAAVGR